MALFANDKTMFIIFWKGLLPAEEQQLKGFRPMNSMESLSDFPLGISEQDYKPLP